MGRFDFQRFIQRGGLRRVLLLAALCAGVGWAAADLIRAGRAERVGGRASLEPIGETAQVQDGVLVGRGSYLRAGLGDDDALLTDDIPAAIRRAREQGAKARAKAVEETILNEKLGRFAKDRGWAQGGPYFPLGADLLNVRPRERPRLATPGTYESLDFAALPLSVPNPVSRFRFGPGDPATPPRQILVDTFGGSTVPPPIPEPATWALLILGFWGLAWRLAAQRRPLAGLPRSPK